jgi:hypothetical protein
MALTWEYGKGWHQSDSQAKPVESKVSGFSGYDVIQITKPGAFEKNREIFIVKCNQHEFDGL